MTTACAEGAAVLAEREIWTPHEGSPGLSQGPTTLEKWVRSELRFPGATILVHAQQLEPRWLYPLLHELAGLIPLRDNWDSYGGRPVAAMAVETAIRVAVDILESEASAPTVVPTSPGGVQLEWHANGIDFEIAASPDGRVSAYYHNNRTGITREHEEVRPAEHLDTLKAMAAELD